ncbi:ZIP family metal transporter [Jejuia pallidilutea]|uniref:Zinc transporter n=1 Tax=Jejuia pallidilutea TaxID=504487 RepID=A0A090VST6_9FLAO|nr:ZIP family metal transporter [Jejuia pallidilutea]PQV46325.1 ZIP zinc transporter [Jejuia pallidilutea]GAL67786.1 zinc transporter [Jejuia pallidilutea]GAL73244.1 zinc transporter [Jejuia pallidilutea]GAL90009.1 zinc transporter [Jejuia pallidilutea]
MNKFLFPVYAVILGVIIAKLTKHKNTWNTKLLLSFSGAFLLALTLFELLPEVYHHLDAKLTGLYIMCGILLQIVLELFSKGAEHGHVHIHKNSTAFPWLLFISLCIHSFLEGFPIHQHNDMVYGVLVHKIPIAALVSMFLFKSNYNTLQIVLFLVVFAAMTPLGTLISNTTDISEALAHSINAVVIGIFFHISTTILFETGEGHKFNLSKFISIILGVGIAYFI